MRTCREAFGIGAAIALGVVLGGPPAGCGKAGNQAPVIDAVEPGTTTSLVPTAALIRGHRFYNAVSADLGADDPPVIDDRWRITLGDVPLDTTAVVWVDTETLAIVVPADLPTGAHDVTVASPDGLTGTLTGGLVVTGEPVGLTLSIEDAPGGSGGPVSVSLAAGEDLTVHAVVRDALGAFVTDIAATWEVVGDIGEIAPGPASAARLDARRTGSGRIRARRDAADLIAESGEIDVSPGPPATLAIFDRADELGAPIGGRDDLTTDPSSALEAHAVSFDAFGNRIGLEPVAWTLSGLSAPLPPGLATGVVVDFTTPGAGSLSAAHPVLATASTGTLLVAPGRAATLAVVPATLVLGADDPPVPFAIAALDSDGNPTWDAGAVTWSIASGPITAIDAATGLLDPTGAGTGTVRAVSSYGPTGDSGAVTILPGAAATLTVVPDGIVISADDPSVPFTVSAVDADGNPTDDQGTITWSVTGPITAIDPLTGVFDPTAAGTGTVRVTSSLGPGDDSAAVTVVPGRAAMIAIVPDTLVVSADDAPVPFTVTALDLDGNPTLDVGVLTWSIGSGPVGAIDPLTGVLDPGAAGTGAVLVVSDQGPSDLSGAVTITPGRAALLDILPDTLTVNADASPVVFAASGLDSDGNVTADLGALTWSIASGPISAIDAGTGAFTPGAAGVGSVGVASAYGVAGETGAITVVPGRAAAIWITPDTLAVDADAPAFAFAVSALDADGNATTDLGGIAWSIASGPITAINAGTGQFTPGTAGTGTVRATSGYGPVDDSGAITVTPGVLATLAVTPATAIIPFGGGPAQFSAAGWDADGNATGAVGSLTWSVASGPIGAIDSGTGLFTPISAGSGTVQVTSSLGPIAVTGPITVGGLLLTSLDIPAEVTRGQGGARVEAVVMNAYPVDVPLTGAYLTFAQGASDRGADYFVTPDFRNPGEIPAGSTITLAFDVTVVDVPFFGAVDVTANVQGVVPGIGEQTDDRTAAWTVLDVPPPNAVITSPVAPGNRICAGGTLSFSGASSTGTGPLSYLWDLPGGSPSFATSSAPAGVAYAAPGSYPFGLTVTDGLGRQDAAFGAEPIYVGTVDAAGYATGSVRYEFPTLGQLEDMGNLPDARFMHQNGGKEMKQCDGAAIPAGENKYLTVWVDRGVIPVAMDDDPSIGGIQIQLSSTGLLRDVALDNSPILREGPGIAYSDYRRASDGAVTASGWVPFVMTSDDQPPIVAASVPASSCGASICRAKGEPLLFHLSEPIQEASLDSVLVEAGGSGSICADAGAFADITAGSSITYEPDAMTATVVPQILAPGSYKVRVRWTSGVHDTSSNANPLIASSLCVNVGSMAAAPAPSAPTAVAASPDPFSPDYDGVEDGTTFQATVGASATAVRVVISRGASPVIVLVSEAAGPGNVYIPWDGRDVTGRMVPDGNYLYRLTTVNRAGVESEAAVGVVTVDSAVGLVGVPGRF